MSEVIWFPYFSHIFCIFLLLLDRNGFSVFQNSLSVIFFRSRLFPLLFVKSITKIFLFIKSFLFFFNFVASSELFIIASRVAKCMGARERRSKEAGLLQRKNDLNLGVRIYQLKRF